MRGGKGQVAYLSSFRTGFSLMQAAMMMPEATQRPLSDKLIAPIGLVPLSSSIGSGWPSTLRTIRRQTLRGDEQKGVRGFKAAKRTSGW